MLILIKIMATLLEFWKFLINLKETKKPCVKILRVCAKNQLRFVIFEEILKFTYRNLNGKLIGWCSIDVVDVRSLNKNKRVNICMCLNFLIICLFFENAEIRLNSKLVGIIIFILPGKSLVSIVGFWSFRDRKLLLFDSRIIGEIDVSP